MPDVVAPEVRSRMMAAVRSKDTKPEVLLRSALHRRGLRFRLHDSRLPGKPDIVFPGRRAVVFVNGCFWHGHDGCPYFRMPATRTEFWGSKIGANRARDEVALTQLAALDWRVAVVWECATRDSPAETIDALEAWLRDDSASLELGGR